MTKTFDLTVFPGREFTADFQLLDDVGDPVDITGATVTSEVRDLSDVLIVSFTGAVVDGPTGVFSITANAIATAGLTATNYFNEPVRYTSYVYDVLLELAGGDTLVPLQGEVYAVKPVTEAP